MCAFWRKIGPHQDSDPSVKATQVNPRVVRAKLLLNGARQIKSIPASDVGDSHFDHLSNVKEPTGSLLHVPAVSTTPNGFCHKGDEHYDTNNAEDRRHLCINAYV